MSKIQRWIPAFGVALLVGCGQSTNQIDNVAAPPENTAAFEPQSDDASAPWGSLREAVGKYPREIGLFETSPISADLKNLLGDEFDTFKADMDVQGPLAEENGILYTSGNKAHQGGSDAAYLLIDPVARQLEAGIWENGKLTIYASPGSSIAKPNDVRTMIANAAAVRAR